MDVDLTRFHAGDERLFTALVATYSPRLMPLLRRYAGQEVGADDLLQEVWLRVHGKRHSFDGRGSFLAWLWTVSRTVGIAAVRKRSREPVTEELQEIAAPAGPDPEALPHRLRDAVLSLPERQRDVVVLRLIEGMSTTEAARVLHCAEGTVKASLHQATRNLRELMKERRNDE